MNNAHLKNLIGLFTRALMELFATRTKPKLSQNSRVQHSTENEISSRPSVAEETQIPKMENPVSDVRDEKIESREIPEGEKIFFLLKQGQENPATGDVTRLLRKFIEYEFKFLNEPHFDKTQLQCTEYAHFRVKQKLGISIIWPSTRPRNGKDWPDRLSQSSFCQVLDNPVVNCTMSFTEGFKTSLMQQTGHVAFVEEVFPDSRIRISEVNWDNKGSYQERELTEAEWKNRWKGRFISFL